MSSGEGLLAAAGIIGGFGKQMLDQSADEEKMRQAQVWKEQADIRDEDRKTARETALRKEQVAAGDAAVESDKSGYVKDATEKGNAAVRGLGGRESNEEITAENTGYSKSRENKARAYGLINAGYDAKNELAALKFDQDERAGVTAANKLVLDERKLANAEMRTENMRQTDIERNEINARRADAAFARIEKGVGTQSDRVITHQFMAGLDRDITHNQETIKMLRQSLVKDQSMSDEDKSDLKGQIKALESSNVNITKSKREYAESLGIKLPAGLDEPASGAKKKSATYDQVKAYADSKGVSVDAASKALSSAGYTISGAPDSTQKAGPKPTTERAADAPKQEAKAVAPGNPSGPEIDPIYSGGRGGRVLQGYRFNGQAFDSLAEAENAKKQYAIYRK